MIRAITATTAIMITPALIWINAAYADDNARYAVCENFAAATTGEDAGSAFVKARGDCTLGKIGPFSKNARDSNNGSGQKRQAPPSRDATAEAFGKLFGASKQSNTLSREDLMSRAEAAGKRDVQAAKADAANNPFGKKKDDGRAPYAKGACAKHKPSGTGKVDWDYVRITNNCAFPIQVLSCYYKPGQQSKCNPRKQPGWGTSSTIKPGGYTTSIATTPDLPWMVSYYVCNMSGVKKHNKLCLLPDK